MTNSKLNIKSSFLSLKFLKYFGIVFAVLFIYTIAILYNKYGDEVLSKSLTLGQHIKLSLFSFLSLILTLLTPLLFFSCALLYRSKRLKRIGIISLLKKDLFILIPFTAFLWIYSAFYEQSTSANFYSMIWEIEELEPGQSYIEDSITYELFKPPNLIGMSREIDSLDKRIKIYGTMYDQGEIKKVSHDKIVEDLEREKQRFKNKKKKIHLTPIYIFLSAIFGMLLGYSMRFNIFLTTLVLLGVNYFWNFTVQIITSVFKINYTNKYLLDLYMIVLLVLINLVLFIFSFYKTNQNDPEEEFI